MEPYVAARHVPSPEQATSTGFVPFFSVLGAPSQMSEPEPMRNLASEAAGPQVELVQSEGRVTKIVVTCRCCERIELECEY